jgi:hypothetical protein
MEFYTYAHSKPNGTIFYIGKGQGKRAYDLTKRNVYWKRVAEKYGTPTVEILAKWKTEKEALDHEVLLISCFKDMGYKLANLTNGGEGSSGYKHTQESIDKIAKIKTDNPNRYWLGKPRPQETKDKISKALIGVGKPHTEETKEKMAKSHKGKKQGSPSLETRKKLSLATKKVWEARKLKQMEKRI